MDKKHDLDTDEICSEKVSDESKITPRLRAKFVGVIVTLLTLYSYLSTKQSKNHKSQITN